MHLLADAQQQPEIQHCQNKKAAAPTRCLSVAFTSLASVCGCLSVFFLDGSGFKEMSSILKNTGTLMHVSTHTHTPTHTHNHPLLRALPAAVSSIVEFELQCELN